MWNSTSMLSDFSNNSHWGMDLDETDAHYIARMEAPGFEVGDFTVSVSGNQLLVKAEREESHNGKNGSSYRCGQFQRSLSLPEGAQSEDIEANYHSGVLELKVRKGKESQNVKRITVNAA